MFLQEMYSRIWRENKDFLAFINKAYFKVVFTGAAALTILHIALHNICCYCDDVS